MTRQERLRWLQKLHLIQKRKQQAGKMESSEICEECREPIPENRRKAVPGCTRCLSCQAEFERRVKSE
ncbi:MAG: molecular chaperone DnaK [Desulfobulbus propionicus]|nr:MAG: molecular chaperone DnaK [Desulfobulbus propionicus]